MDWRVFVILVHCLVMDPVTTTSSPQQSNIGNICESNINRHKNTCYWIERPGDTFDNMRARCASKGGTLAAIDSPETSNFVTNFHRSSVFRYLWIGYKEPNDRWDDGSRFSWTNYIHGFPRADAGTICMLMHSADYNRRWLDYTCSYTCPGLCQVNILNGPDCLLSYQGSKYWGIVSVTQDGLTCQAWGAQEPHKHNYTDPAWFPDETLEDASNHCRNPDNRPEGPWCYTTDTNVQWGFCDIPSCTKTTDAATDSPKPQECSMSAQGWEYVGHRSVTANNRTCQAWRAQVPTAHNYTNPDSFPDSSLRDAANYCRMPAGSDHIGATRPWCYTTDSDVPWEQCDIPICRTGPDCLLSYQGSLYWGNVSVTQDGLTCQAWGAQEPHENAYTDPSLFPDETLKDASNYCRNPDNRPEGPWCYTTDTNVQWGFCDIPSCTKTTDAATDSPKPQECLMSAQGWEYVGHRSVTASNRTCQAWRAQVPTAHNYTNPDSFPDSSLRDAANYCRMPAGSDHINATRPWCYTTDSDMPWENCDIPKCPTGVSAPINHG